MSIHLGSTNFGSLYLGSTKIGEAYLGSVKVYGSAQPDPYNPLNLPPYTIRVKIQNGATLQPVSGKTYTQVSTSPNVWDISGTYWGNFWNSDSYTGDASKILEVLGANSLGARGASNAWLFLGCTNLTSVALFDTSLSTSMGTMFNGCSSLTSVPQFDTSNVTDMSFMFGGCTSLASIPAFDTSKVTTMEDMLAGCDSLTTVPLFDTRNVTNMREMLYDCDELTSIPLFDTSKVTDMYQMCLDCMKVQSGALALYQQASSQATPPTNHSGTFRNCGYSTQTGNAELHQIPTDWGGMGS